MPIRIRCRNQWPHGPQLIEIAPILVYFAAWSQTSNATDMSTMYPYAHHNTIPAAFLS